MKISCARNSYLTDRWLILTACLSDESAVIWFVWWWIGERILRSSQFPPPPSHPIHTHTHTPPRVSCSPRPPARPGGWLTFDGWQAVGSRCRRGTSSAWFHSASPPPSNLVNNIKCWSGIENVSALEWLWHVLSLFLLKISLSHTHARNALFIPL